MADNDMSNIGKQRDGTTGSGSGRQDGATVAEQREQANHGRPGGGGISGDRDLPGNVRPGRGARGGSGPDGDGQVRP